MVLLIILALFMPHLFLLSISLSIKQISLLSRSIQADATLKLNFEKPKGMFFNFQYEVIHQYKLCIQSLCKSYVGGPSYDNYQPAVYWPFTTKLIFSVLQAENSMTGRGEVLIQVWLNPLRNE